MMKAYKIKLSGFGGFSIYLAETAGEAKTYLISKLQDAYSGASYAWISSCVRAPEFDNYSHFGPGCIAWHDGYERWQIDAGHWFGGTEPAPMPGFEKAG